MANPYKSVGIGNRKTRAEHRVIVERREGRTLGRFELVHHKNEQKRDNADENLAIVTPKEHAKIHLQKHPDLKTCEFCGKEFAPAVNHRARTKTCSRECRYGLLSETLRNPLGPRSKYRENATPPERSVRKLRKRSSKRA
jgi:hypothetical protein